jgi:hypothetical protein
MLSNMGARMLLQELAECEQTIKQVAHQTEACKQVALENSVCHAKLQERLASVHLRTQTAAAERNAVQRRMLNASSVDKLVAQRRVRCCSSCTAGLQSVYEAVSWCTTFYAQPCRRTAPYYNIAAPHPTTTSPPKQYKMQSDMMSEHTLATVLAKARVGVQDLQKTQAGSDKVTQAEQRKQLVAEERLRKADCIVANINLQARTAELRVRLRHALSVHVQMEAAVHARTIRYKMIDTLIKEI